MINTGYVAFMLKQRLAKALKTNVDNILRCEEWAFVLFTGIVDRYGRKFYRFMEKNILQSLPKPGSYKLKKFMGVRWRYVKVDQVSDYQFVVYNKDEMQPLFILEFDPLGRITYFSDYRKGKKLPLAMYNFFELEPLPV